MTGTTTSRLPRTTCRTAARPALRAEPHRFHFSQDAVATCRCGRWAVAKIRRFRTADSQAGYERPGTPFVELTEQQALKDWGHHVANLPDGQTVHSSAAVRTYRASAEGRVAA